MAHCMSFLGLNILVLVWVGVLLLLWDPCWTRSKLPRKVLFYHWHSTHSQMTYLIQANPVLRPIGLDCYEVQFRAGVLGGASLDMNTAWD